MSRPYGELAAAIVRQAIKDWKDAMDMLKKVPEDKNSRGVLVELEFFFKSEWFSFLRELAPDIIPEDMIGRIQEGKV